MNEHQVIGMFTKDWYTYTTTCIIAGTLVMILCSQLNKKGKYHLRTGLGVFTLASAILIHPYLFSIHEWTLQDSLPLHMCELSEIFAGIVLIWPRQRLFEILCYWGIPGGLHSILTPELLYKGENGLLLFQYYYEHSVNIVAPVMLMVLFNMRLSAGSWLRAFAFTNLCIPIIGTVNWLLGSNYMYLAKKPVADNPFVIGDWPWYLLVLEFVVLVHFYLVYVISTKKIRIPKALLNSKTTKA
jgi:hypothetical integral membrane protein (TIGR02206 family)